MTPDESQATVHEEVLDFEQGRPFDDPPPSEQPPAESVPAEPPSQSDSSPDPWASLSADPEDIEWAKKASRGDPTAFLKKARKDDQFVGTHGRELDRFRQIESEVQQLRQQVEQPRQTQSEAPAFDLETEVRKAAPQYMSSYGVDETTAAGMARSALSQQAAFQEQIAQLREESRAFARTAYEMATLRNETAVDDQTLRDLHQEYGNLPPKAIADLVKLKKLEGGQNGNGAHEQASSQEQVIRIPPNMSAVSHMQSRPAAAPARAAGTSDIEQVPYDFRSKIERQYKEGGKYVQEAMDPSTNKKVYANADDYVIKKWNAEQRRLRGVR